MKKDEQEKLKVLEETIYKTMMCRNNAALRMKKYSTIVNLLSYLYSLLLVIISITLFKYENISNHEIYNCLNVMLSVIVLVIFLIINLNNFNEKYYVYNKTYYDLKKLKMEIEIESNVSRYDEYMKKYNLYLENTYTHNTSDYIKFNIQNNRREKNSVKEINLYYIKNIIFSITIALLILIPVLILIFIFKDVYLYIK